MTEIPEISQAQFQFIMPHPTEAKVALMPVGDQWQLPSMASGVPMKRYYHLYVNGYKVQQLWDWDIAVMYQAQYYPTEDFNDVRVVYVVDNLDKRDDLPNGGQWFSHDELADLPFTEDYMQSILKTYFDEQTNGIPERRTPWGRIGWHQQTMQWLQAQLDKHGYTLASDVQIMRVWCITALYKVPTNKGDLYFKAVPPTFTREVGVTQWLREQFGTNIPEIVAYDSDKRLVLMADFGGQTLRKFSAEISIEIWREALRQYGALQAETTPHIQSLLSLGAMDYRLDTLLPRFEALLQNEEYVKPNWSITAQQIEKARQTLPQVRQHIEALQAMNLPNTILHGDFHAGNISVNDDNYIFYDWTDAAIGIPLLDLHPLTHWDLNEVFPDDPTAIEAIINAYFDGLSNLAPKATWQTAYQHTKVVSIVYHAVNYQHLLSSIEPNERWIVDMIGELLQALIEKVETK